MDEFGRDAQGRLPLFEPFKLHRKDDPITSHMAAEAAESVRSTHFRIILAALEKYSPGTSQEIAAWSGLDHWAVTRRMGELRDAGLVIQTQEKRANRSGRMAVVWARAGDQYKLRECDD
jgi:predicted ArsR family transcriptional regulator